MGGDGCGVPAGGDPVIICQPKEEIAAFVAATQGQNEPWGEYTALGLLRHGALVAGVIYNHFGGAGVCAHIGAIPGGRWMTRGFLHAMFDYPFGQLGKRRITALVSRKNRRARRFAENLGFKYEGTVRHALQTDDLILYGMLREECRFLPRDEMRRAA